MTLPTISPAKARELLAKGAVLVDIREADEHARERIPGALHAPLSTLGDRLPVKNGSVAIFHCRSGNRTATNASRMGQAAACEAYILEGGLDAWRAAGLPTAKDSRQPIELIRQVQITAGILVLLGVILGTLVAPGFYGLSAFVGAGLVFAGVSGWCGMARLLGLMPWNRRVHAAG